MRKVVGVVAAGAVAASLMAPAQARQAKQEVTGTIALPAPFVAGDVNSCYSGLHRRTAVITQEQVNGIVGYHFDIDPATWGGKFTLEVTDGQGDIDFDITFYTEFGTPEQAADTAYAPVNVSYEEREPGGEVGTVPPEMNKAIVCMWAGESHQGFGGTFAYTATPPKKKKK